MSENQVDQFSSQKKANPNFYALSNQVTEKPWNSKLPSLLSTSTNSLLLNEFSGLQQQSQDLSAKTPQPSFLKFAFGNKKKTLFIAGQNQLNQFKFGEKGFANSNSNNEEIQQEKKNKNQLLQQIQKTLVAMNKAPLPTNSNQGFHKQSQNSELEFNTSNPQVLQFQHQFRQLKNFAQEAKQKFIEKPANQQQQPSQQQPLLTKKMIPNINFHKQSYFQQLCNSQNNKEKPINSMTQLFSPTNVITIKKISPSKMSFKKHGIVHAFAARIIRKSNEDRVSIVLNIKRPDNKPLSIKWPQCSYFAIYDGHGGITTAEFLKDNLHQYIIKDPEFPDNPKQAIINGFASVDNDLLDKAQELISQNKKEEIDLSGSCAIAILIVDKIIYVANVGDSRAILSQNDCTRITALSQDHKPVVETELQRILKAGGQIYQNPKYSQQSALIMPSRLNVSRTLGDVSSKIVDLGGRPGVILSTPEIYTLPVDRSQDFIFLGSDGIFDRVSNELIIKIASKNSENGEGENVHERAAKLCENVIKEAVARRSADNLTAVVIVLPGGLRDKKVGVEQNA